MTQEAAEYHVKVSNKFGAVAIKGGVDSDEESIHEEDPFLEMERLKEEARLKKEASQKMAVESKAQAAKTDGKSRTAAVKKQNIPRASEKSGGNERPATAGGRAPFSNDIANRPAGQKPAPKKDTGGWADGGFGADAGRTFGGQGRGGARGGKSAGRGGHRDARFETQDGENVAPKPHRDYDRKSGSNKTGVKPVDKKEGGGAHNWGNVKEELKNVEGPVDGAVTGVEGSPNEAAAAAEAEQEPEMTLEQYEAELASKRVPLNFKERQANDDGHGKAQKLKVVHKPKTLTHVHIGFHESRVAESEQLTEQEKTAKALFNVKFSSGGPRDNDDRGRGRGGRGRGGRGRGGDVPGFGGRGGRGGPRGGGPGGRGGPRDGGHESFARRNEVKFDFSADSFPTLGA